MAEQIDRRRALALGAGLAVAAGCGGAADGEQGSGPPSAAGGAAPRPAGSSAGPDAPPATPAGDPPRGPPAGAPLTAERLLAGVDTIVVLMMENRSFDHFYGQLALDPGYGARAKVNGLTGTEWNPDGRGGRVLAHKMEDFTPPDPPHSWDQCHAQWNQGQNDGFVRAHAGAAEKDVMGWHDRSQLPFMYWLADEFTVCDAWFASVMGPTWPNRYYLHAAGSAGEKANSPFKAGQLPTLWERLRAKGEGGKNYTAGQVAWFQGAFPGKALGPQSPVARLDDFFADARSGNLPPFAVVDPDFTANDDHPSHDIRRGQALIASMYRALAESPQWKSTLFVITYDEHGGFYDHAAPPKCADEREEFRQLGFRVPSLIIGPHVRKGHVLSAQLEHASVAATLAKRYGIQDLGQRMTHANDLSGAINPARVDMTTFPPPPVGPKVELPQRSRFLEQEQVSSQPELAAMLRRGTIPARAVDPRSRPERLGAWLRHAAELDVLAPTAR